jgi:hypothetical protein
LEELTNLLNADREPGSGQLNRPISSSLSGLISRAGHAS